MNAGFYYISLTIERVLPLSLYVAEAL